MSDTQAAPAVQWAPPSTYENQPVPKSLARKLAEVMGELHRVPKRGRNQFHGYSYVTESDLADVLRGELAKRSLIVVPCVLSWERETVTTKSGFQFMVTVWVRFTFMDGETGECWNTVMPGQASDTLDKAIYKAITGCQKYLQMKTFLVSSGDDPEEDNDEERRTANGKPAPPPKRAATAKPPETGNISALKPSDSPNRGHGNEGLEQPASRLINQEQGLWEMTGRVSSAEVKKGARGKFVEVVLSGKKLYCFREHVGSHLLKGVGKVATLVIEEASKDGKKFGQVQEIVVLDGQRFEDGMPVIQQQEFQATDADLPDFDSANHADPN